jgi:hypothetical protein
MKMDGTLYVADEFQTLANQKMLAVGLYADRIVFINIRVGSPRPAPETPAVLEQFALLLNLTGVSPGQRLVTLEIFMPSGKPFTEPAPPKEFAVEEGTSMNLLIKAAPFFIREIGTYVVKATVDTEAIERTFDLRVKEVPESELKLPIPMKAVTASSPTP